MFRRQASLRKWAAEMASRAKFTSTLPPDQAAANPSSLPVPCLTINNKADLRGVIPLSRSSKTCHELSGTLHVSCVPHLLVNRRYGSALIAYVH